ncbi:MAG TPA: flagellar biosynthesis protein FlgJ [Gammaproteobacteria bacterium]|nr:flagellar biosynthesis protein FlgJ [Gammaproteobacteria bacterium]
MKKTFILSLILCSYILSLSAHADIKKFTSHDLDMSHLKGVKDKKKRFFNFLRPIVIDENAKILALRKKLVDARKNRNNHELVAKTAEKYHVKWTTGEESWKKLLERVDAVALELVLAQSANESAWGQSRFAKEGNNFFGQWCYRKGCGIIPKKRDKGTKHEVAKFKSVNDSVASYIRNINNMRVYSPLRDIRRKNRAAGKKPDANAQAGGLIKYSTRREKYVKEIRSMIRVNKKLMLGK